MRRPSTVAAESTRIVVRAGATDRFAALRAAFEPEGVDVVWDRRQGQRRHGGGRPEADERRRSDRRGPQPPSWTLLDFVVVLPGQARGGSEASRPRGEGRRPAG